MQNVSGRFSPHGGSHAQPSTGPSFSQVAKVAAGVGIIAAGVFISARFRVALPGEYIVKTGLGIETMTIAKTAIQWPFQTASVISMTPTTLDITFDGKSAERVPFKLPTTWTIGPKNTNESLAKYALRLLDMPQEEKENLIRGTVLGDARVIVANLPLDTLFADRDNLRKELVEKVDQSLEPFGLAVHNANIRELDDLDEHNRFFAEQKRRALSLQQREGDVAEKTNSGETRQKIAEIETSAVVLENTKAAEREKSAAELAVATAAFTKQKTIAQAEAAAAAEERTLEVQRIVEEKRRAQEIEKLRATGLAKSSVDAEIVVRDAEGKAQAMKIIADAERYQREQNAEAALFEKRKEAEGVQAVKLAEAKGLETLMAAAGSGDILNKYMLVTNGTLPLLAEKQADALRGLAPKVNVWSSGGKQDAVSTTLTDLFKTGMPLFEGIKQQTGYDFLNGVKKEEPSTPSPKKEVP